MLQMIRFGRRVMAEQDPIAAMKARWSYIQPFLFPFLHEEVDPLTAKHEQLVYVLDTIGLEAYVRAEAGGRGRPREDRRAIARAFVAKAVLGLPTTRALIERLAVDASLRRICGWERRAEVPSEPTFSRAFQEFAEEGLIDRIHQALVERSFEGRIVGVVARDATEIEAREKPAPKDDEPPPPAAPPRKRGRPRKDQPATPRVLSRLERQPSQAFDEMCAELPIQCDVGTKTNSKGFKESWTGYKAHIDVACGQIPVSLILTSASLHDSQAAIPLMTMTEARIAYLYEVMDAAYDAENIHQRSQTRGHVAVIDPNYRADSARKEEWAAEVERRKLINMPDFDDVIYDFRTMAERVNARLKDEFGGRFVRVRGAVKVKCHLMFGILALTADQLLRLFTADPAPA
jgi:transposase